MWTRVAAWAACVLVLASATTRGAGGDGCGWPVVNKRGFRPHAVVAYTVGPSPGGAPFPAHRVECVARAFDAWTRANRLSGLDVRFVPGHGGLVVRVDRRGGLVLPGGKGGAWTDPERSADGFLEHATIWLSSDERALDSCDGVTKVTLHELGHLHGLRDNPVYRGPSVMNRAARRDDTGGRIPFSPTWCDAVQARTASSVTGDVIVRAASPAS